MAAIEDTVLRLWCDQIDRSRHNWRDLYLLHKIDTTPEDCPREPVPCPAESCAGSIIVSPLATLKRKAKAKPRRRKKKA